MKLALILVTVLPLLLLASCEVRASAIHKPKHEVGVLLVSHGSHSPRWRQQLKDLELAVAEDILANPRIDGIRTAYMEYTEPSIATQLKAFDAEGYAEVIVVPVLLTVSSHSFDDIPTIVGLKSDVATEAVLASEGIECYKPRAKVRISPLLDFAEVMGANLNRRVASLSKDSSKEGVVLVAYGSTPFDEEWRLFMEDMAERLKADMGIDSVEYSWCGHIVSYSPEPTAEAIERVLAKKDRALVVPVLVAVDEDFQMGMIMTAAERTYEGGEVSYIPDSILPETHVEDWVRAISLEMVAE